MKKQRGFTLVELMISLTIGLIISASIIQVMVSNNATERLNRALASAQESGRFIISRLRSELLMTGRYDLMSPNLNNDVDTVIEADFVHNSPIPLPGDFSNALGTGAKDGASGASDTLVVTMLGTEDCRGVNALKYGYLIDEEFLVVNEYFLDGTTLKCRGFDGRVLRGKSVTYTDGNAYTLLDDVYGFQVQYGVTDNFVNTDNSARPVQYLTADKLAAAKVAGSEVVAIRIAVLVKADSDVIITPTPSFKLLNETAFTPSEKRLYKQFETTVILRNSKNTIRSRNI